MFILGIVIFIVALSVSIALHEAGHMTAARLFKLKVPRFFVGFGSTIFSKKIGETEYGIKALPLGGFVNIEDDSPEVSTLDKQLLSHVHPFKRIIIFVAGPLVNIVLGIVILMVAFLTFPVAEGTNVVNEVVSCEGPDCSDYSTIQNGDRIVSANGHRTDSYESLVYALSQKGDMAEEGSALVIERNGELIEYNNIPGDTRLSLNVMLIERNRDFQESAALTGQTIENGINAVIRIPTKIPEIIHRITGDDSESTVAGVVAAGKVYGDTASSPEYTLKNKVSYFMTMTAGFNLSLGLLNLLPIPPLDGGRILVAGIDWLRMGYSKINRKWNYKPLSARVVTMGMTITGIAVFSFMVIVVAGDVAQIISGNI